MVSYRPKPRQRQPYSLKPPESTENRRRKLLARRDEVLNELGEALDRLDEVRDQLEQLPQE